MFLQLFWGWWKHFTWDCLFYFNLTNAHLFAIFSWLIVRSNKKPRKHQPLWHLPEKRFTLNKIWWTITLCRLFAHFLAGSSRINLQPSAGLIGLPKRPVQLCKHCFTTQPKTPKLTFHRFWDIFVTGNVWEIRIGIQIALPLSIDINIYVYCIPGTLRWLWWPLALGSKKNPWCFRDCPSKNRGKLGVLDTYIYPYLYVPRTQRTSIFHGQPSKTKLFSIKTRVIWVLGIYIIDKCFLWPSLPHIHDEYPNRNQHDDNFARENLGTSKKVNYCWWFQPIWKILVKLDHVPKYE